MFEHCEAFLVPLGGITVDLSRAGTLIRLRDAISTLEPSFTFWSRLDVEARHAPERMHDE